MISPCYFQNPEQKKVAGEALAGITSTVTEITPAGFSTLRKTIFGIFPVPRLAALMPVHYPAEGGEAEGKIQCLAYYCLSG